MKSIPSYLDKILVFIPILLAVAGCQRNIATSVAIAHVRQEVETPIDPIRIPSDFSSKVFKGLQNPDAVFDLYRHQGYAPVWLVENERSARADSIILMIRSSRRYGLLPQQYHLHEIPELVLEPMDRTKMTRLDVILTDAFLSMAHDLKNGRLKDQKINEKLDSVKLVNLVDSIKTLGARAVLESQEPVYEAYGSLKSALQVLLDTVNVIDQNILMYGITNDSSDVHRKVQRIEINLERWRTENQSLDQPYTWINIPAYMLYVIENNKIVMESRIVVGTTAKQTPQFSSDIECFTIFPYWYVPRKITVEEYLPVIKNDTSFITRNNFDVLDLNGKIQNLSSIEWKKYNANNFPFMLRQREGKENSLGIIRFTFDNPYAVFLHDTNAKRLFANKVRAFSHGCIRLEKAYEFAHYLINGNRSDISSKTLDKYLSEQKRRTISLLYTVPIHIRYFTCEVRDGTLVFYNDIYKKDNVLIRKLYNENVF